MHRFAIPLGLLFCTLSCLGSTAPATLPSVSELLDRSNAAVGGVDAIVNKTSYAVRLRFEENGRIYRGYVWGRPPYDYRLEIHVDGIPGAVYTESSNGERIWRIALTKEGPKFEEEEWYYRPAFDFFGPNIHPEEKGISYSIVERTEFEGTRAYKVEVTYPGDRRELVYFACGSALPLGYCKKEEIDNEEKEVLTVITEYEFVGDVLVSRAMNDFVDGNLRRTVTLENLIFDQPLQDYLFEPPSDADRWK